MKCCATTHPCFWWDDRYIDFPRCRNNASVEIDGLPFCLQHAGKLAVLKLIAKGEAKKLKDTPALCSLDKDKWARRINRK